MNNNNNKKPQNYNYVWIVVLEMCFLKQFAICGIL